MNESNLNILAAVPYTSLVTFSWGNNVARYTRWPRDLTFGSDVFTSVASMVVKNTKPNTLSTEDYGFGIQLPDTLSPVDILKELTPVAPVSVVIEEAVPEDVGSREVLAVGNVSRVRPNTFSGNGIVDVSLIGVKTGLKRRQVGLIASSTCRHAYGVPNCFAPIESQKLSASVASVGSGAVNRIALSFTGSPTVLNSRFARGYLELDGLRITIRRAFEDGSNPDPTHSFDLREVPPARWLGQTIVVAPGCDGLLSSCRDPFRNQESQFLAPGAAMPKHNPVLQDSAD